MKKMIWLLGGLLAAGSVQARVQTFDWTNGSRDGDFHNAANWDAAPVGGNNYLNIGSSNVRKADLTGGETDNFAGIRIGYSGADGELVQSGGVKLYNRAGFPASPFRNYTDYELKVSGGEGSAKEVDAGTVLKISAPAEKDGKKFDTWLGGVGVIGNPASAVTSVTMPKHDLYLVPVYK